jgi:hypothetical protein
MLIIETKRRQNISQSALIQRVSIIFQGHKVILSQPLLQKRVLTKFHGNRYFKHFIKLTKRW